jgi:hypothetical protein
LNYHQIIFFKKNSEIYKFFQSFPSHTLFSQDSFRKIYILMEFSYASQHNKLSLSRFFLKKVNIVSLSHSPVHWDPINEPFYLCWSLSISDCCASKLGMLLMLPYVPDKSSKVADQFDYEMLPFLHVPQAHRATKMEISISISLEKFPPRWMSIDWKWKLSSLSMTVSSLLFS